MRRVAGLAEFRVHKHPANYGTFSFQVEPRNLTDRGGLDIGTDENRKQLTYERN